MKKTVFLAITAFVLLNLGLAAKTKREIQPIGDGFTAVELATHGELNITIGDQVKLEIEADKEILQRIRSRIEGDTLKIYRKRLSGNWLRDLFRFRRQSTMRFHLTVRPGQLSHLLASSHGRINIPELTGERVGVELSSHGEIRVARVEGNTVNIDLSSHGNLAIDHLQANSLRSRLTSHGMVRIRFGQVDNQNVSLTSHGDYLSEDLQCKNADVELTSHGTAKVFATEHLHASITSHGKLYYRGHPDLDIPPSQMKRVRQIH